MTQKTPERIPLPNGWHFRIQRGTIDGDVAYIYSPGNVGFGEWPLTEAQAFALAMTPQPTQTDLEAARQFERDAGIIGDEYEVRALAEYFAKHRQQATAEARQYGFNEGVASCDLVVAELQAENHNLESINSELEECIQDMQARVGELEKGIKAAIAEVSEGDGQIAFSTLAALTQPQGGE